MVKHELEERLIDFAVQVNAACKSLSRIRYHLYLEDQMTRSSTSAALNYGEARGAESQKDFIHKLRLVLKELRETHISLRILLKINSSSNSIDLKSAAEECNQLISIFVSSIKTANKKLT